MKIYTKTGDAGETGLFGGGRVPKTDPRVEAYGTVDELNAHLGLARAHVDDPRLDDELESLQNVLFDVGADLATPPDATARRHVREIAAADVEALEAAIDRYSEELEPLSGFILPGGAPASAALHVARAVARRAERNVVALSEAHEVSPHLIAYLNRVSDLLFTLARIANVRAGVSETGWQVARGDS